MKIIFAETLFDELSLICSIKTTTLYLPTNNEFKINCRLNVKGGKGPMELLNLKTHAFSTRYRKQRFKNDMKEFEKDDIKPENGLAKEMKSGKRLQT